MSEQTNKATLNSEREANGQFTSGNKGGPGDPFAEKRARMRGLMYEVVTEQDMVEVFQKLKALAKAGKIPAMRLLFAYQMGLPAPHHDPDPPARGDQPVAEELISDEDLMALIHAVQRQGADSKRVFPPQGSPRPQTPRRDESPPSSR